jgi:hypothetical protein
MIYFYTPENNGGLNWKIEDDKSLNKAHYFTGRDQPSLSPPEKIKPSA